MRFATYNLRFDSQPNNITVQQSLDALGNPLQQPVFQQFKTEQPWSTRRIRVAEHLQREGVVIAGFQEALVRQVNDLATLLGSEWSWIGVGRDDGVAAGEFSPIFYNSDFKLLSNDSFWLSNTPFEPSKFPGAGSVRICTAAHFSHVSGKNFTYLNTHLDDQSDAQRRLGASMLLTRARFEAATTNGPVIITGDFNSPSTGSDSGAYGIITGATPPVAINATFAAKYAVGADQFPDFKMLDLRGQTPRRNVASNFATFTGFTAPNDTSHWTRIDFVYGGSNMGWTVDMYAVGTSLSDDGILASDHRPVFADISI
ncbi:Endonuclease/exonuclease/phosphatase [Collybia nuda]|uniref:Endonuclease/exonuclease/phosphatase n=1 Tax=Collybia nuda TaxID=64659 RepID=A0A9P6CED6_9AGAR|nr:Endonuclease/exonuclease/phosphatase [Collybia nuda]